MVVGNGYTSGENPKRGFQGSPGGPQTRMGEAWKLRMAFERARAAMDDQDAWCLRAERLVRLNQLKELEGSRRLNYELAQQPLIGLVHVHLV
jgi:hypothetical protein